MRLHYEAGADVVTHETFRTMFDRPTSTTHEDSAALDLNSPDDRAAAMERHLAEPTPWGGRRSGPPKEFLDRIRAAGDSMDSAFATPRPTRPLVDGQTIKLARREWVAMHTPGHTYDHLCLYDPEFGVVLTGDHVLPSITPHISGLAPEPDPLALFFASLTRMAEMTDISIALPAHGHPFEDLRGRAGAIIEHHEERLDIIREALPNSRTARSTSSCACCSGSGRGARWPRARRTPISNTFAKRRARQALRRRAWPTTRSSAERRRDAASAGARQPVSSQPATSAMAWSRIDRPRSSSSSVMVSGGAMRNTPPMPRSAVMFIDRPSSKQRRVIAAPSSGLGFFDSLSVTTSRPDEQAPPAHVADAVVALAQLAEPGHQSCAGLRRPRRETVAQRRPRSPSGPTAAGSGSETCVV